MKRGQQIRRRVLQITADPKNLHQVHRSMTEILYRDLYNGHMTLKEMVEMAAFAATFPTSGWQPPTEEELDRLDEVEIP